MSLAPRDATPPPRATRAETNAVSTLVIVGIAAVIAGGLIAAVTDPLRLADGSWAAAYLVLVWGVAQVAIGAAQYLLAIAPSARMTWSLFALWNAGNAAVLIGTLVAAPGAVVGGSVLLLVALVAAFVSVRGSLRRVWAGLYRALVVVLFVSVFVGIALSFVRHS